MKTKSLLFRPERLLILALCALSSSLQAQSTFWWRGATNGNLTTAGNWASNSANTVTSTVAPGANDNIIFSVTASNNIATNRLSMGNGSRSYNSITLSNSGTTWIMRTGDAGGTNNTIVTLTLNEGITNASSAGAFFLGDTDRFAALKITGTTSSDFVIANNSSSAMTFQSTAGIATAGATSRTLLIMGSGTGNVIFTGGLENGSTAGAVLSLRMDNSVGTLTLGGSTFTGGTTLDAGTIALDSDSALGTATVTINGGTLASTNSARTLVNSIVVGGNFAAGGLGQSTTLSGGVDLNNGTRTITVSDSLTLGGIVSNGGLSKAGDGNLILSGDNLSLSGTVTLSAGTLSVGSANALGTGALALNSGTLTAADGTARTIANATTFGGSVGLGNASSGNLNFSGSVSFGSAQRTVTVGSGVGATFSGTYGTGGVTKAGAGSLIFASDGSITSLTNTAGNVTINEGVTLTTTAGVMTVASGASFNINGTWLNSSTTAWLNPTGIVTVGSSGAIIQQGNAGSTALLITNANTTWASGSTFIYRDFTGTPLLTGRTYQPNLSFESTGAVLTNAAPTGVNAWTVVGNLTIGANYNFNFGSFSGATDYQNNITIGGTFGAVNGALNFTLQTGKELLLQNTGTLNMATGQTATIDGSVRTTASAAQEATISGGTVSLGGGTRTFDVAAGTGSAGLLVSSVVSSGTLNKIGEGRLTLSGDNSYAGGTTLSEGILRLTSSTGAGTGLITQSSAASTLVIDTTGTVANAMDIYNISTLQTVTLSGNKTLRNATFTVAADTTTTESGNLSGEGGITKDGAGTLLVTGNNTFTGATAVNAGVLELASTVGGAAALTSSVSVAENAVLLISQSNQVNNSATVTLSGGTITRGSGVSEVFGNLNLTEASFLDFGSGGTGTLSFGTYTPSALLTVSNFFEGNVLTFGSNLTSEQLTASFSFDNGFTTSWNGTDTFTITAIPEPSTYAAAAGLLAMMLWPARRRLLKDVKSVLGLRAPMRDRLAKARQ
jgi:fibronectin-binding autotransporter adhesin